MRTSPTITAVLLAAVAVAALPAAGSMAADPDAAVVARYPSDGEMVEERVVTPDDVANASAPRVGRTGGWQTQIQLTDDGAASFAETLVDTGFTSDGVDACHTESQRNDDGYCLLTVVDGEVTGVYSLSRGLAETVESGEFEAEDAFVFRVANETNAERAARAFGWTPKKSTTATTTDDATATATEAEPTWTDDASRTTQSGDATATTEVSDGDGAAVNVPGFGALAAVAAVAFAAIVAVRRST